MKNNSRNIFLISFALILFSVIACDNQKQPGIINNSQIFAGTWHLISRIDKAENGEVMNEPSLGSDPIALIMYDHSGNMSVQIMKRDRNGDAGIKSAQENSTNSAAINGYDAYFGTYAIDTINHQIKHHLTGAIDQKDHLVRYYSITGDTLVLWFSTTNANIPVTRTLTWDKLK